MNSAGWNPPDAGGQSETATSFEQLKIPLAWLKNTTLVGSAAYSFNPTTGNTVTITFTSTSTRYVRVNITANTGGASGQLSEVAVLSS